MTRRTKGLGSFLAAIFILALIVATAAAGLAAWASNQDAIRQQLDRDRSAIDADMVSARAAHQNGDDPAKFLGYCDTAVATYNADASSAGPNLPAGYQHHLDTNQECKVQP